jgi:hypothetical protein
MVRTCTVVSARDQQAAAAGHKLIKELQGAAAAAAKTTTKKNGKKRGTGLKQHVAVAVAAAAAAAGGGVEAIAASSHPGSCTTKKQHVQAEVLQTSCFFPKSPTTSARSSKPSSAYSHESRISSCPPVAALELLEGATAISATQLHQYSRNHHQSLQGNSISHDRIDPAGAIISGAVEDHDQRDLESRELLETSCCCSSSSSSNFLQSTNMQQLQDHHDAAHDTRFLKPM